VYNLNYAPTTLGVQSWREIICGGTRTKKVEYYWSRGVLPSVVCLSECDREASILRKPWPTRGCYVIGIKSLFYLVINSLLCNLLGSDRRLGQAYTFHYKATNRRTLNMEAVISAEILTATYYWTTLYHIDTETGNMHKVFRGFLQFLQKNTVILITCLLVPYHWHVVSKTIMVIEYVQSTLLTVQLNKTIEINLNTICKSPRRSQYTTFDETQILY
jgi:hypothetical protein